MLDRGKIMRCIIMQRPPIGNLYDTVIFIATAVTLMSLVVELMSRRRFGRSSREEERFSGR